MMEKAAGETGNGDIQPAEESPRLCKECGNPMTPDARYCNRCGLYQAPRQPVTPKTGLHIFITAMIVLAAIIALIALIAIPGFLNGRRAEWETQARANLRSIGSSELAYQGMNNDHFYGTIDALKKGRYIAEGLTLSNMVENYSLSWTCTNPSRMSLSQADIGNNKFIVIAFPRDTRPGFLHTFAITEDQSVRVYNPTNSENRWNIVITWDPIL